MRVLFLNRYAGVFGGVETYIRRAAKGLSERGVECMLGRIEDRGGSIEDYLAPFASSFAAPDEKGLAETALALAPDVLFLHKLGSTRMFLPLKERMRLVRYVHDHDLCCPRRHKYYAWTGRICSRAAGPLCHLDAGFVERRGGRFALKSAAGFFDELEANRSLDLLLANSAWMRDELLANGFDPGRVAVLAPSTPPVAYETGPGGADGTGGADGPGGADDFGMRGGEPYILYVGQLIRGKGVDLLLEAFARLKRTHPALTLRIAGSGNAEGGLREKAQKLGVRAAVRFEGQVDEATLDTLYSGAALLAVPSRWPEPFGMVGLEAMRRSLPVAAFASGGITDWLEDGVTGHLARAGDSASLAVAMARILDDPARARAMGVAGREKAEREFSFSCSMDSLALYLAGSTS